MNLKTSFIQLPRRSGSCHKCQEPLCGGSECYSLLTQSIDDSNQEELLQRQDFCLLCWKLSAIERGVYWKSTIEPKQLPNPKTASKNAHALQLFRKSVENQLSSEEVFCLALYLIRKKLVQIRKEISEEGNPYLLLEILESGELLAIRKIDLNHLDLASLQKSIASHLSVSYAN
jgi:hypothetical protein